ncbi:hypothetical protein DSL72_001734 [Monilinia vaccinii-corymbosi]|uniref:SMODS and SLOG-associating 2TM effector domain-containing protein n=1 Tax=Monilinia vaccinii-corymbosi TaxID=61207 RepID=A0A8A3P2U8_9HELO|nr:hypothetical protein DSL72_001734 [Monilinia vaccinii-corymbosi]
MSGDNTPLLSELIPSHRPLSPSFSALSLSSALQKFRLAIGINVPIPLPATSPPSDLEALRRNAYGIYKSVLTQQSKFSLQYHFIEGVYYFSLLSQIVIGGILASFSELSQTHPKAVTTLGVVSSSLAGVLGILKSQGLPDRLRKDEFEMRKVQDFIEECDTRLAVGWGEQISDAEVDDLIKEVFDRYGVARDTAEMNRPNIYAHQADADDLDNGGAHEGPGEMHAATGNSRTLIGGRRSKISVGGHGKCLQIY